MATRPCKINSISVKPLANLSLCITTPNFNGGGAERIAVNLANEYTEQGYGVTLLVLQDKGPYKRQLNPQVRVEYVNLDRGYKVLWYLIKYFRKKNYTHVLSVLRGTNILVGLVLWFNLKPKLVFREADELTDLTRISGYTKFKTLLRMRLAYFRAQRIIANAKKTKEDLQSYKITSSKKVTVIHNPVLSADYKNKLAETASYPFEEDCFYFLNVGRLCFQKNQELLIKAFAAVAKLHANTRLLILGEGEEQESLQNLIQQLDLTNQVRLLEFQNNPFPYYKQADCFVLSSRWEGFGNVIVEALSAGTPVISTACGGPQDILQNNKYGVLVNKDNQEELTQAMLQQITGKVPFDAALLEQRAEEFTVANKAKEYLQFIQSV